MKELATQNLPLYYIGPDETTPCHNVLYFSLSGPDSLTRSPYCHPAQFLAKQGTRVFSVTLPHHEGNARPSNIRDLWNEHLSELQWFIEQLPSVCDTIQEQFHTPVRAFAGLSRGALIACHLAAKISAPTHILGFAPLLRLGPDHPLNVTHLLGKLHKAHTRFYIGHKDTIVHTNDIVACVQDWITEQQQTQAKGYTQLVLSPSVGRGGHGTLDPQFKEGTTWLKQQLDQTS